MLKILPTKKKQTKSEKYLETLYNLKSMYVKKQKTSSRFDRASILEKVNPNRSCSPLLDFFEMLPCCVASK